MNKCFLKSKLCMTTEMLFFTPCFFRFPLLFNAGKSADLEGGGRKSEDPKRFEHFNRSVEQNQRELGAKGSS